MEKLGLRSRKYGFSFSKTDGIHAVLSVIPSIILILSGNVSLGVAFAIGTLPTNQLGIAPKRKQRIMFGLLGCIFGVGILTGSYVALLDNAWSIGLVFLALAFLSAVIASRRPVGAVLLSLILPAIAVGIGFSTQTGLTMFATFVLGSLWSSLVTLFWPESNEEISRDGVKAFVATQPRLYGLMLGLAAMTAILFGFRFSPEFLGWTATAVLLIMRPYSGMVKKRSFWRATATVLGGVFAVITVILQLPNIITAFLVLGVMVLIIGTSKSDWWLMPLGTAFFVLTLSLLGETDTGIIKSTALTRILDNIVGALIAVLFGLVIPWLLIRLRIMSDPVPSTQEQS